MSNKGHTGGKHEDKDKEPKLQRRTGASADENNTTGAPAGTGEAADQIQQRKQEQDTARSNVSTDAEDPAGKTGAADIITDTGSGAAHDEAEKRRFEQRTAEANNVRVLTDAELRQLAADYSLAERMSPADRDVLEGMIRDAQTAGASQVLDASQASAAGNEAGWVHVNVPRGFQLRLDHSKVVTVRAGAQRMPLEHAEHWYSKANGVQIV